MFYTIFILFFFSLIILIKRFTNYYSVILCLQTLFLDVALIALLISIAKLGNYQYPNYAFLLPDYSGYLMLSKVKISLYTIIRIQNIGFAGFLVCLPFFMYHPKHRKNMIIFTLAVAILPLFYIFFYDPSTKQNILYVLYSDLNKSHEFIESALKTINALNFVWISAYLIIPLVRLLYLSFKTISNTKKKQFFSLFFTLLCLNMLCMFIFILGPLSQSYTSITVDKLLGFPDAGTTLSYNYTYLPVLAFILSTAMLILLFRFRGLDRVDFFRSIIISRMAFKPNKDIRNILHTYKNEMLSINMIAKQLEDISDEQRRQYLIERLNIISEKALSNIGKSMSTFKQIDSHSADCNVIECVENVLAKISFDKNISVNKDFSDYVFAFCDKLRLENSLENILINSIEAIRIAARKEGKITISVESEFEWVFIRITDNGTGIPKKNLQKIFSAFYSTKLSSNNWGIGLNYVFRSIKKMKGFVFAQSEPDKYTTFTIMLQRGSVPISKKSDALSATDI